MKQGQSGALGAQPPKGKGGGVGRGGGGREATQGEGGHKAVMKGRWAPPPAEGEGSRQDCVTCRHPSLPSRAASGRCVLTAAAAGVSCGVVSALAEPNPPTPSSLGVPKRKPAWAVVHTGLGNEGSAHGPLPPAAAPAVRTPSVQPRPTPSLLLQAPCPPRRRSCCLSCPGGRRRRARTSP